MAAATTTEELQRKFEETQRRILAAAQSIEIHQRYRQSILADALVEVALRLAQKLTAIQFEILKAQRSA